MLAAAAPSGRDVVFASSLVLASVGLLPLLDLAQRSESPPSLTSAELLAPAVCGGVAALGLALLALLAHSTATPRRALRLAALGVSAAAVAAAAALALGVDAPPNVAPSAWSAELFAQSERAFEQRVNDVYCHAKGQHVCAAGSVADARQVFPIRDWPVGSTAQPGKRVAACCEGYARSLQRWGYPGKMELCRVCSDVRARRRSGSAASTAADLAREFAELQRVVPRLSVGELMWCGAYLTQLSTPAPPVPLAGQSPYRAHRDAFRELLVPTEASPDRSLCSASRALQVLLVASVAAAAGIRRWMAQLEFAKAVA